MWEERKFKIRFRRTENNYTRALFQLGMYTRNKKFNVFQPKIVAMDSA